MSPTNPATAHARASTPSIPLSLIVSLAWRDLRASGRGLWIFFVCLLLGVALVTATAHLHRQIAGSLSADSRALFGADLEIESGEPLPAEALAWLQARGTVSTLIELRTMLRTTGGETRLVTLQTVDQHYPLYGELTLSVPGSPQTLLTEQGGIWGVLIDPVLAQRASLNVGDRIGLGQIELEVRGLLLRQPDRSLRAEWRGAPVLLSDAGLQATGLIQAFSRQDYLTRLRTSEPVDQVMREFMQAFPRLPAELATFEQRSARMAEVLAQVASGLLLIGFSALFIGGLGIFNSIQAYLDDKLASLATLQAMGWGSRALAAMVLLQVLMLALFASLAGATVGSVMAAAGLLLASERLPLQADLAGWVGVVLLAPLFGLLTALCFSLPALGRALMIRPASLFRGLASQTLQIPKLAWWACAACIALLGLTMAALMPDPRFMLALVLAVGALLLLLEGVLRGLRALAARVARWNAQRGAGFAWQLALAQVQHRHSALRMMLLSLGTALTLLVASSITLAALIQTLRDTVPDRAPALVLYDLQTDQIESVTELLRAQPSFQDLEVAPFVQGRLIAINGLDLRDSPLEAHQQAARDLHKFSDLRGNVDDVVIRDGAWWSPGPQSRPLVSFEDREGEELGVKVGDVLQFEVDGETLEAEVAVIHGQRRLQSRLWLEGIFSDGVLEPFITRHVGAAYLSDADAIVAQDAIAQIAPNVISVRTEALLTETRRVMDQATAGLAIVALVCLSAALLVLASVVAASRARQVREGAILHALGARLSHLQAVVWAEHAVLGLITTAFAVLAGGAMASVVLHTQLELAVGLLHGVGLLVAAGVSAVSLSAGAAWLGRPLRQVSPASLMRA